MAKQSLQEVINEIRASRAVSKKGEPIKTFSRADLDRVTKALLNEVEHTVQVAGTKNGELVTKEVKPVQEFRKLIRRVLLDFGVDKQEAERVMTEEFEFTHVDGMYEIVSETIYQYMEAGKKFDFLPREDFMGSLTLKEVGETVTEYKNIQTKEPYSVKRGPHKLLERKSKTPSWLKETVNPTKTK